MKKLKIQIISEGNCQYICKNRLCKKDAVFALNNKKYCCQHSRIIIQKLLNDTNIHEFYESKGKENDNM